MPIHIEGADALIAKLSGIAAALLPAAAEGMEKAMQPMVRDAKTNCPVDTGMLRGSIQATVQAGGDAVSGKLYSASEYALYVEMGTGPKGEAEHAGVAPVGVTYRPTGWVYRDERGFHYTTGQPARPFLYPAFKANKRLVLGYIAQAIRKRISG